MQNFQNELHTLGMDNFQVGELIHMDPQSQDPRIFGGMRCGGGGMMCGGMRCGGMMCGGMRCGGMMCGGMRCGGMMCGGMRCGGMMCGGMRCGGMRCGGMMCGGMMCGGFSCFGGSVILKRKKLLFYENKMPMHLLPHGHFLIAISYWTNNNL